MVRLALVALPVAFLIASISGCGSAAVATPPAVSSESGVDVAPSLRLTRAEMAAALQRLKGAQFAKTEVGTSTTFANDSVTVEIQRLSIGSEKVGRVSVVVSRKGLTSDELIKAYSLASLAFQVCGVHADPLAGFRVCVATDALLKNDVTESVYAYCESEDAQIKAVPFLDSVILKGEPLLRRF